MKKEMLEKHMKDFYEIRGDNTARAIVELFITGVSTENIPVKEFTKWSRLNDKKLFKGFKSNTKQQYKRILNQYIRYVTAIDGIQTVKRGRPKPRKAPTSHSKVKTRIYSDFHEFVKFNS